MRFLVVEDESCVADVLRRCLEELGNTCVVAETADRAVELMGLQDVDAVTLDLAMPGRGGLDWLEEIASERPELARRTLVITGQRLGADSVERVARCGAGVLAKPFTLATLEAALRTQIDWPHASRPN